MSEADVDVAVKEQYDAYHRARVADPSLLPYMGPVRFLERFLAGAVVTADEFIADESEWCIFPLLPPQMRRLKWMSDH